MPASLGSAVLYLEADDKKLKSDVNRAKSQTLETLNKVGKGMRSAGTVMTAGLTAPLLAAGVASVDAASDLEESMNAVNVVFEDAADIILKYSENSAEAVGLSSAKFNQLSAVTGAFLTNLGYDSEQAANKTIELTERASDMASVFNTDVSQALEAIQSGLKGEFNPLEQFGVKLNAAAIEAKAMSMGLADVEGNLNDNAKAQAALALIMEQTSKLQGDFRNTSDSLSNSTRITQADFENQAAALGTQLLPIATQLVGILRQIVQWFGSLSPEVQTTILVVAGLVAAIGPLLLIIGNLITSISAIIPVVTAVAGVLTAPLIAVILAVVAAIAVLAAAWANDWGGIREKTFEAVEAIKTAVNNFLNQLRDWWAAHGDQVKAIVNAFLEAIWAVFQRITDIISSVMIAFQKAREGDWYAFGENLRAAWDKAWNLIKDILSKAWEFIKTTITNLIQNILNSFKNVDWAATGRAIVDGIANGISSAADRIKEAAIAAARAAWEAVKGFFGIRSPSRLMAKLGFEISAGLAEGIDNNTGAVVKSALRMSQNVLRAAAQPSVTTNIYELTANYPSESPVSLVDKVKMLQLLGGD